MLDDGPHYLCLASDLMEGQCHPTNLFGDPIIVGKKDGKIFVDKNICRHRGFPICEGDGKIPEKCPYHGLAYRPENRYAIEENGPYVFVAKKDFHLSIEFFDDLGEAFQMETNYVRAPFHLWVQNVMDPNHLESVHPSFSTVFKKPAVPYEVQFRDGGRVSSYKLKVSDEILHRYRKMNGAVTDYFLNTTLFPNLSISTFMGVVHSVESVFPIVDEKDMCYVVTRFFKDKDNMMSEFFYKAAINSHKRILAEDVQAVETWFRSYKQQPSHWLAGEERIKVYCEQLPHSS